MFEGWRLVGEVASGVVIVGGVMLLVLSVRSWLRSIWRFAD